ncbi:band 7 protein [Cellulosilyticum lentocellum DSM 5427]|uniref:Band 7 protein n=2 Tax=Cellulosilyticum lentocellum TaxID=29360 RepID=F2JIW5_CELLD|nr:band 7 protein [Cellulosilyticum lentocellum DSM 5427]
MFVFRWSISIPDYMAARHYRFGKPSSDKPLSGSRVVVIPSIDHLIMIDQRIQKSTLENISVLTKERQAMKISATLIWKTQNAAVTIENIKPEDIEPTFFKIIEAVIKNECSKMSVDQILENRSLLSKNLNYTLKETTDSWGITISSVNISNLTVVNDNFMKNMALPKQIEMERQVKLAELEKELTIELKDIEKRTKSKLAELEAQKVVGEEKEKVSTFLEKAEKERVKIIQLLQKEVEQVNSDIEQIKESTIIANESERIKANMIAEAEGLAERFKIIDGYSNKTLNYEFIKLLPDIYKNVKMGDITLFQNASQDKNFDLYSYLTSAISTIIPNKEVVEKNIGEIIATDE